MLNQPKQQLLFDPYLYLEFQLLHIQLRMLMYKVKVLKLKLLAQVVMQFHPQKLNDVCANCFNTGISKSRVTPPIKNESNGKIVIKAKDIYKTGNCLPSFS